MYMMPPDLTDVETFHPTENYWILMAHTEYVIQAQYIADR